MSREKVTYVNLTAESDELHKRLDVALRDVRAKLPPAEAASSSGADSAALVSRSPSDQRVVIGRLDVSTEANVKEAVAAARAAWPAWRGRSWEERVAIIARAASIVRTRSDELAAWLILETGKNRVEAIGEIEETADLYEYYAEQMRAAGGFVRPMASLSPADTNTSVLRPYGVWAVIAPWNFPYALLGAPIAAALVAGNTVVCKASEETPVSGVKIVEIFREAGVPADAVRLVTGDGAVGAALSESPGVDGITFTGSYDVGFRAIYQKFAHDFPRPCVTEMGGKNAAIVTASADLERAVSGVYRSAFGMTGQKCSSCSRAFVQAEVYDPFVERLVARARDAKIGDPSERTTFMGPLGTREGYEGFQRHAALARKDGVVRAGGNALTQGPLANGFFVEPTIVTDLPRGHALLERELFVPLVCVERVASFDEAIARANDTRFGLTAGLFSSRDEEIAAFFDRIEAGVVYVNRAAGATTGAWPGVQPFGGWKASGSTGRNIGGPYTLTCYLREQSRTLTR
jgi:1-pyrroline-5-carboxylate dehydrogenase